MLTDAQYALISHNTFFYPTHPGPLIITDGTNTHANSNIWINHTKEVRLFREATGAEQALVQQIVGTVKDAYLAEIWNRTTKPINYTVEGIFTNLQENYGQLMLYKLLERE